jgi:ferredoxin--NADP+ reductase
MMRAVVNITSEHNTPTIVSLNPIMVDGIGMCGGCRAKGRWQDRIRMCGWPEFDGRQVDFDSLMRRNNAYRNIEAQRARGRIDAELSKGSRYERLSLKERMTIERHSMQARLKIG